MLSARNCRLSVYFLIVLATAFLSACDKPINLSLGQSQARPPFP